MEKFENMKDVQKFVKEKFDSFKDDFKNGKETPQHFSKSLREAIFGKKAMNVKNFLDIYKSVEENSVNENRTQRGIELLISVIENLGADDADENKVKAMSTHHPFFKQNYDN